MILGYWYNNLGGSDRNCLVRNSINGLGFVCYMSGAVEVASESALPFSLPLAQWLTVVSIVVASTVHTQDMYDQAGDHARGRQWSEPLDYSCRCDFLELDLLTNVELQSWVSSYFSAGP